MRILSPPTDYPYGERQYTAEDPGAYRWTFTQSIADIDPASWGATSVDIHELSSGVEPFVAPEPCVFLDCAVDTLNDARA